MHNYSECIQSVNFSHSIAKSDDDDDDDDDEEEEGLSFSARARSSLQQVAAQKIIFLRTYHFRGSEWAREREKKKIAIASAHNAINFSPPRVCVCVYEMKNAKRRSDKSSATNVCFIITQ
jgi:hypothetical protein